MQIAQIRRYLADKIGSSTGDVRIAREYAIEILNHLVLDDPLPADVHSQLTASEAALYSALVKADGDIVSHQRLMFVADLSSVATVHVYINRLRRTIARLGWKMTIKTVSGRGYYLRKELIHETERA